MFKKHSENCSKYHINEKLTSQMWMLLLLLLSRFSRVRLCATHRRQATRLHHPWDSPGKNTGVGCHFFLQCMKVKSESEKWKWSRSVVSNSSRPHGLQPTRLLHPWDFPGKSTGVGCHCLLRKLTLDGFIHKWSNSCVLSMSGIKDPKVHKTHYLLLESFSSGR